MTDSADIASELKRDLRLLIWATIALYVVVLVSVVVVYRDANHQRDKLRRDETRTNAALCALRADVQRRIKSGEGFLAAHPSGIPGIPAATLRVSLDSQGRTVKALAGLRCEAP